MELGYKVKSKNPKENANFLSKLFFGWMVKIVRKGTKKGLELSDLYKPLKKDSSEKLGDNLEAQWKKELDIANEKKREPSFLRAIMKAFASEIIIFGVMWFIYSLLTCLAPVILARLISLYAQPLSEKNQLDFYLTTSALIGSIVLNTFFFQHTQFGMAAVGMRVRIATSSLVYRKITRLNHKALSTTAVGQVINLLSNDVSRFDLVFVPIHSLWVMPFQVLILSYFMWRQVGISCLAGISSMAIVSLPVQGYLAKVMGNYRSSISQKTDRRVKLMSEIISGMQVIKMYAWEKPFEKIVKMSRVAEIKDITATSYIRGVYSSCSVFLERSALFFTLICFVLQGNILTADVVFSLAQAYNVLQMILAIWFPFALSLGAETLISVKRLQEFLLLEEITETSSIEYKEQNEVILSNVNASWTDRYRTLQDINLNIPSGSLCAIVGPVGAGKSSLLQLLLGELPLTSGSVQMGNRISYCSQDPWLFQSTVRNNILFGQLYDKARYNTIVKVCCLDRDLEQFPQGDETLVGERGVTISGGQKARINLARALYRQADIYLLDDPLSAVDAHVGKQLFEECISKHLRGTTRILITHQLQYLEEADLIVVMNEGVIEAQGTFGELANSKLDFTKLLAKIEPSSETLAEIEHTILSSTHSKSLRKSFVTSDISQSNVSKTTVETFEQIEESGEDIMEDPESKPFKNYLLAPESICLLVFLALMLVLAQVVCTGCELWVTFWTLQEGIRHSNNSVIINSSLTPIDENFAIQTLDNSNILSSQIYEYNTSGDELHNSFSLDDIFDYIRVDNEVYRVIKTNYAMYIYAVLIGGVVIITLSRSFLFFKMCMMSSVNLHSRIFHTLLKAPMKFFNENPSGRILNRFSKDMGAIDEILPRELLDAVQIFLVMCGILINVAISNPYAIIAMIILGALFLKMRSSYLSTAKALKHLEGRTKSPVFSQVNSTFNGITTIRACQAQSILIDEFDDNQDVHTSSWYLLISCIYSFGLWLDILSLIFISCVSISFIILHTYSSVNGSMVGLALAQSMILTGMLQFGMRQAAEVINQLTSVERVLKYTKIDTEGPFETPEGFVCAKSWPKEGSIDFEKLSLKYVDGDPSVLKDLNFSIRSGEKIGIVGRTGAGKSSLIAALFRLAPFEGSVYIDNIDTERIGLSDLRKKISIIPQEPILFSASLRYNLDPFDEYTDEEIWKALEEVELRDGIDSLEYMVTEGGNNFSLGQRQLICLARAALRNNKILILDEATANVDPRTDLLIQTKIREKFSDCTVLTIAHRLNTIMDSNRVLVMSYGKIVEFDHPHKLLQKSDGHFHSLVMETGNSMATHLKDIAMEAYEGEKLTQ